MLMAKLKWLRKNKIFKMAKIYKVFQLIFLVTLPFVSLHALTCTWDGTNGNWTDASKWSCGVVPGASDDVIIGSGYVTLDISATISNMTLSGNISGSGDLTLTGNLTWNAGRLGTGSTSTGSITVNGTITAGTNAYHYLLKKTLNCNGGLTWSGTGFFFIDCEAVLNIPVGQTFTASATGNNINPGSSCNIGGTINIAGTFTKTGTYALDVLNNVVFVNNGIVNVTGGQLSLNSSSAHSGTFDIASGATLRFDGGTQNINSGCNFTGSGNVTISNSTVTLNANSTISGNLNLNTGGTLNGSNNLTISGNMIMGGGNVTGTGDITLNGNLTLNSGSIGTSASTTGTITVSGLVSLPFVSGQKKLQRKTLNCNGGISITDAAFYMDALATLNIPSGQNFTCSYNVSNNDIFGNSCCNTGGTINCSGTFIKNGANNLNLASNIIFNNTSAWNINGGTVFLHSNSDHTGTFTTATGATLDFDGGTHNINSNCNFAGSGNVSITSTGTVTLNTNVTIPGNLTLNNGTLNGASNITISGNLILSGSSCSVAGTGDMTVTGTLTWNGGSIGTGTSTTGSVTVNGLVSIPFVSGQKKLQRKTLNCNVGFSITDAAFYMDASATLNIPSGQYFTCSYYVSNNDIFGNSCCNTGGTINCLGTFIKNGAYNLNLASNIAFKDTSTWNINGGTLNLNAASNHTGTFFIAAGATLQIVNGTHNFTGCTFKGSGTFKKSGGTISFSGTTVSPGSSPGTFTFSSALNLTGGTYNCEIVAGSPVTYDKIVVSGAVTLGGTLNLIETGTVAAGSYTILTASSISGSFSQINLAPCYELEILSGSINIIKGVTKIWDSTVNNWNQDVHWSPFGVPCPYDKVIINAGECSLNINPDMKSLTINGGTLKKVDVATYSINAKTTVAAAGKINVFEGTLDINDTLDNNGTIQGFANMDIINATVIGGYGKWAPGNSTGVLDAKGTYNNEVIEMEIGGNGGGIGTVELDKLNVSQTMVIGGNLDLLWLGGTIPAGTRTLMECSGGANCRTGTFANITFPAQCNGKCNIIYTGTEVQLQNTEPIEFSGTCTWLGGTGNWSTVAKWSCNDVPNFNDDVVINSGTVTIDIPTTVKTLNLGGNATLTGDKLFTISNAFNWSGGELAINNTISTGAANISGSGSVSSGNLVLSQGGTLTNAALMLKNQATLTLPATKTLDLNYSTNGAISVVGSASIVNNGSFFKTGVGNLDVYPAFFNNGILKVGAGTFTPKNNLTNNNIINGVGTLNLTDATVLKMGTMAPGNSPGTINVTGNYFNQKIIIEIQQSAGLTTIDKLIASGDINLGGVDTLVIDHLGGVINYANYNFLSCTGGADCRSGIFNSVVYPTFCNGECSIEYLPTVVNLKYEELLPVELAYFTGRLTNKEVQLDWTTLSEENAASFDIMRSANGNEWVYLGEVAANGTTSSIHDYSFIDSELLSGENYYRLKQHDLDGTIYYSKVIRVQTPIKKSWKLFPNPVGDVLEVRFSNNEDGILQIFDATGRLVLKQELQSEKSISIDLSNLNSGLYWVQMTGFKTEMVVKY